MGILRCDTWKCNMSQMLRCDGKRSHPSICDTSLVTCGQLWQRSLNMWQFYTVIYCRGYFTVDMQYVSYNIWYILHSYDTYCNDDSCWCKRAPISWSIIDSECWGSATSVTSLLSLMILIDRPTDIKHCDQWWNHCDLKLSWVRVFITTKYQSD